MARFTKNSKGLCRTDVESRPSWLSLSDGGVTMMSNENKRKVSFFVQNLIVLIVLLLILGFFLFPELISSIREWMG